MSRRFLSGMLVVALLFGMLFLPVRTYAASSGKKAGQVTISSGWLNVRTGPSSSTAKAFSLQKGTIVTLLSKSGQWWYIEYADGQYGYCHQDYITVLNGSESAVVLRSGYLNVRSGPGTGYSKTASLRNNTKVVVLSQSSGWSRILYHGSNVGYVSSDYLSSSYRTINLDTMNFKQMDPQWADKTIASSGKTFAQIGCATTAIAIVDSYKNGRIIYPDEMAKTLRYTSSGNVYWPAYFSAVTDSSGYLQRIYQSLMAGKPVILGLRNQYGQQHWVVVVGFTGGNELNASSFIIRDPGSNYRRNLQQVLNQYPVFYKLLYY